MQTQDISLIFLLYLLNIGQRCQWSRSSLRKAHRTQIWDWCPGRLFFCHGYSRTETSRLWSFCLWWCQRKIGNSRWGKSSFTIALGRTTHSLWAMHGSTTFLPGHWTSWSLDGQARSIFGQSRPWWFIGLCWGYDEETWEFFGPPTGPVVGVAIEAKFNNSH